MAVRRSSSALRGRVVRGESGRVRPAPAPPPEPVADPTRPRAVIDHALQRRAAIARLRTSLSAEHLDADPYLLRAARHHGEVADSGCPACRDPGLVTLRYVFGDELGPYSGRIRGADDLPAMAHDFGAFTVCVVEVCQRCHWNFLLRQYVLGDGVPRPALRTPRDFLR